MARKRINIMDVDTEQALCGAVLAYPDRAIPLAQGLVQPEDFVDDRHRRIWIATMARYTSGQGIDAYTIACDLAPGNAKPVDADYTAHLSTLPFTLQSVPMYANRVATVAKVRRTRDAMQKLANDADYSREGSDAWLADVEVWRANMEPASQGEKPLQTSGEIARRVMAKAHDNAPAVQRLTTAWHDVNRLMFGGYAPGLHIVASRPGGGKSVVAAQTAPIWALNGPVLFYSMEMPEDDIMQRMACQKSGVPYSAVLEGKLTADDREAYIDALAAIGDLPLRIVHSGSITPQRIAAEARIAAKTKGLAGVIVDYVQLLRWADQTHRFESREKEVSAFVRLLNTTAQDLGVPMLVLAQMNRAIESRAGADPRLSDLRECGDIENDAFSVMFPLMPSPNDIIANNGVAPTKFIIAKHRGGKVGFINMQWHAACVRFLEA